MGQCRHIAGRRPLPPLPPPLPLATVAHRRDTTPLPAGPSFYRPQSCFSRDLAVLSAVVHRRQRQQQQQQQSRNGSDGGAARLHVLDLMAGSGVRTCRYLLQAGADHGEPTC